MDRIAFILAALCLTNRTKTPALAVRLSLRDAKTGRLILPAYYSNNYVSLLPGEAKDISIECDLKQADLRVHLDGWNIEPSIV